MPLIRCPHCGKMTFTVSGWADLDRCPDCGRPLLQKGIDRTKIDVGRGRRARPGGNPGVTSRRTRRAA